MICQSIQNQYPATILANMGIPNLLPGVKSRLKGQDITELTSEEERQNLFMASMKGGHKVFMVRAILHTVLPVLLFV